MSAPPHDWGVLSFLLGPFSATEEAQSSHCKAAWVEDMVDLISSATKQENVDVFHRFALLRHWHENDRMPFEVFLSSDGLHMNDWSYNCFAKALADAIADAATPRAQSGTTGAKSIAGEAH